MRIFGAGIRLVMLRAAAIAHGGDAADYVAKEHKVYHKTSGRSLDYHTLLLFAKKAKVPTQAEAEAAQKKPEEWRFIEKEMPMPFVDAQDIVTGKAVFAADVDTSHFGRPGTLTAMIVRCPVANGRVKSFDAKAALAVPGVKSVSEVLPRAIRSPAESARDSSRMRASPSWRRTPGRRCRGAGRSRSSGTSSRIPTQLRVAGLSQGARSVDRRAGEGPAEQGRRRHGPPFPPARQGGLLRPPPGPGADGAPRGRRPLRQRALEIWSSTQGPELTQHYVGLAMMEPTLPNQLRALTWQAIDPAELKEESGTSAHLQPSARQAAAS